MSRADTDLTIGYRAGRADLARKVADELETGAGKGALFGASVDVYRSGFIAEIVSRLREIAAEGEPGQSPVIHTQPNCEFCAPDMFFTCAECKRTVGWCMGCSDDYPDLCDDCLAKKPDVTP